MQATERALRCGDALAVILRCGSFLFLPLSIHFPCLPLFTAFRNKANCDCCSEKKLLCSFVFFPPLCRCCRFDVSRSVIALFRFGSRFVFSLSVPSFSFFFCSTLPAFVEFIYSFVCFAVVGSSFVLFFLFVLLSATVRPSAELWCLSLYFVSRFRFETCWLVLACSVGRGARREKNHKAIKAPRTKRRGGFDVTGGVPSVVSLSVLWCVSVFSVCRDLFPFPPLRLVSQSASSEEKKRTDAVPQ